MEGSSGGGVAKGRVAKEEGRLRTEVGVGCGRWLRRGMAQEGCTPEASRARL